MFVAAVTVYVKKEFIDAFISASIENHENSIRETGNLRFDVLQCSDNPCRFLLYEAYVDESASKAHKTTAHYLRWRDTVESMMEKPREGIVHSVIAPLERALW